MYIQVYYTGDGSFRWNFLKGLFLKWTRGVSFREILSERHLMDVANPGRPHQRLMLFERAGYVWAVPFVDEPKGRFLKTLYRSRKFTKLFRKGVLR